MLRALWSTTPRSGGWRALSTTTATSYTAHTPCSSPSPWNLNQRHPPPSTAGSGGCGSVYFPVCRSGLSGRLLQTTATVDASRRSSGRKKQQQQQQQQQKSDVIRDGKAKETTKQKTLDRLKDGWQKYGTTFLVYWGTLYAVPIPLLYYGITYTGLDVVEAVRPYMEEDWSTTFGYMESMGTWVFNAVVAIEVNGFLELVRLPFVLATTPTLAKWLRQRM